MSSFTNIVDSVNISVVSDTYLDIRPKILPDTGYPDIYCWPEIVNIDFCISKINIYISRKFANISCRYFTLITY